MQENVGMLEQIFRIGLGLGMLPLVFFLHGDIRWIGLIGIIPLVTGIMRWCPGYFLLGIKLDDGAAK
jgi:hypothetical protein